MNFLQRLFSRPAVEAEPEPQIQVVESPDREGNNEIKNITQLSPGLHVGKLTDIGRERDRNEDSLYVIESTIQHDYGEEPIGLFIVADGMGGHEKGEVASQLAARTAAKYILKNVYLPYLSDNNQKPEGQPINEALVTAVEQANDSVQKVVPDGGTTLTIALVMGNNAYIAHIGDSRAYLFNQDELKQITTDHSLAKRLEDLGQVNSGEAANIQNVLYRAIGQNSQVEVDTHIQHLPPGSSLLLCSDGLWGLVEKSDLLEILSNAATPQEACQQLVAQANENGGRDNITAIVATIGIENQKTAV